jgi:hypothetical protein
VLLICGAVTVLLVAVSRRYGYSGDELYFLAAGRHLSWGYAEGPPLLPVLVRLIDVLGGGSLLALRIPAALCAGASVFVTALLARELGGARRAQLRAGALAGGSTYVLATGHLLTTATLDVVWWAVSGWLLVRWVRSRDDRLLLLLGVVTALALQTTYLIAAFWGVAAIAAFTVGPRELTTRPKLWLAGGFALLTAVPSVLWQAHNGWPRLAASRQVAVEQVVHGGMVAFLPAVLLCAGILAGGVGVCYGVVRLLHAPALRPYAFLGWTAIGVTALFLASHGRPYSVAGLFPVLWAAAAHGVEDHGVGQPAPARWWSWGTRAALSWPVIVLSALVAVPQALPITPVTWLNSERAADPVSGANLGEVGWPQLADSVARAYQAVPPTSRPHTVILTDSCWSAAALARFGTTRKLPSVYSPNRGYWYFGAPPPDADTVLYVGDPTPLRALFSRLRRVGTVDSGGLGIRTVFAGEPIWVLSGRRKSWAQVWPELRTAGVLAGRGWIGLDIRWSAVQPE